MVKFYSMGENAVLAEFGTKINESVHKKVQAAANLLEIHKQDWMIEYIPAFTTLTLFYDPLKIISAEKRIRSLPYEFVCRYLERVFKELNSEKVVPARVVEVPVCYGNGFGPDLSAVAKINGLSEDEVVKIHSSRDYLVYMIGFAPGFPYLGGMSKKIAAPRKKTPRLKIPAGSVGIAGMQTGIYPLETPGGWQIIGRTPLEFFKPHDKEPVLLKTGDRVRFKPISLKDYQNWEDKRA